MEPTEHAASVKRPRYKRWLLLLVVLAAIFLIFFLATRTTHPAAPDAISITFLGYTNLPDFHQRFAQFSVSNQADYTVRWWRSMLVEIEGHPDYRGALSDPNLPGYTFYRGKIIKTNAPAIAFAPTLKPGESLSFILMEPSFDRDAPFQKSETGHWKFFAHWRLLMSFSRYTLSQRYYDFAALHHWPLRLGPILLVDYRKFLNPTNNVTASSPWLSK